MNYCLSCTLAHKWQGCARFPEILQNFSERQFLWSLCLVFSFAFALKLSIQTLNSVAPKLPVCLRSGEKCEIFRKTSTPLSRHSCCHQIKQKPFVSQVFCGISSQSSGCVRSLSERLFQKRGSTAN